MDSNFFIWSIVHGRVEMYFTCGEKYKGIWSDTYFVTCRLSMIQSPSRGAQFSSAVILVKLVFLWDFLCRNTCQNDKQQRIKLDWFIKHVCNNCLVLFAIKSVVLGCVIVRQIYTNKVRSEIFEGRIGLTSINLRERVVNKS